MQAAKIMSVHMKKSALATVFLFMLSMVSPLGQLLAFEPSYYDGPGGYMETQQTQYAKSYNKTNSTSRLLNEDFSKKNRLVGMMLGGAVGGGLVMALGLAASPILAVTALVGSTILGGFVGDTFGSTVSNAVDTATSSGNFMTWAGGLAGAALGFMVPGGSVVGGAVGAGLGGLAGSFLSKTKDDLMDMPSRLLQGGMNRFSGSFMGPMGVMTEMPNYGASMSGAMGSQAVMQRWYGDSGAFNMGLNPNQAYDDPYMPMDYRTSYLWHDDNGDLAYPGWQNDLYTEDRAARNQYTGGMNSSEWTYGNSYSNQNQVQRSSAGSIDNPDWGNAATSYVNTNNVNNSVRTNINYNDGDVYSTYTTSDGETFNAGFESGSQDSLINLQQRYNAAVEQLRTLTTQNASEAQRKDAYQEVQKLERMLYQAY
jgi:hypothetical protein